MHLMRDEKIKDPPIIFNKLWIYCNAGICELN
jgi:hypothetical protein